MHITDGWVVVLITVVACILLLSIGTISIPPDDDEEETHETREDPGERAGTGRHRRPGKHRH